MKCIVQQYWSNTGRGISTYAEVKLPQCQFVQYRGRKQKSRIIIIIIISHEIKNIVNSILCTGARGGAVG
jgi:hypothetical protein